MSALPLQGYQQGREVLCIVTVPTYFKVRCRWSVHSALHEMIQVRRGSSGLILDWKQSSGTLLIGGSSRIIRVWDAHTETRVLVRGWALFGRPFTHNFERISARIAIVP
jgi:hypothetical protein